MITLPRRARRPAVAAAAAVLALAALGGSGCARIAVVSEVRPDGSMTRTLTVNGTAPTDQPANTGAGAETAETTAALGPNLSDLIDLPTAAQGWKVTRTRDKTNLTVTATRTLAPGQSVHNDLGIRASGGAAAAGGLLVENTATVRPAGPGRMEYREVLHWRGPRPKDLDSPSPEMDAALKRALPPALAGDPAALRKMRASLGGALWHILFGPGDPPLLPILVMHPDLAEYRLRQQLAGAVRQALMDAYGDRITAVQADTAAASLAEAAAASAATKTRTRSSSGPPGSSDPADTSDDNTPPVALLIRMKLPGKVTATNGQIDPQTGEVYWALYSAAPAVADVTLTATCAVGQKP